MIICVFLILKLRKQEYLESKLYHAYYAFEALTNRLSGDHICGICGIIPDVLFGNNFVHVIREAWLSSAPAILLFLHKK